MSGDVDYLLRVVVADMPQYDAFYKKLISRVKLTDVSSSFAMEQIKYTTALPLPKGKQPLLKVDLPQIIIKHTFPEHAGGSGDVRL